MAVFKESSDGIIRFNILLIPNFTMIAFSSFIETLRVTNKILGKTAYEWQLFTKDGLPVKSSSKIEIMPNQNLTNIKNPNNVVVCSGDNAHIFNDETIFAALRRYNAEGSHIGAVCTGSYILAKSGLLNNYSCALHWDGIPGFMETYPEINVIPELFVFDEKRFTCAGGTSAIDMLLHTIEQKHGNETASNVSSMMIHQYIRHSSENQKMPLHIRLNTKNKKIVSAIELMEKNIETILSRDELAKMINVSPRQLERLFKKHLNTSPAKYYLYLRLHHAKLLLEQTTMPIIDVSLATSFSSLSHFSKCYKDLFQISPRQARNKT